VKIPHDKERSYAFTVRKKENEDGHGEKGGKENKKERHNHSDHSSKSENEKIATPKNSENPLKEEHSKGEGRKHEDKGKQGGKEKSEQPRGPRGNSFMIDPYTGKILGDVQGTKTATAEFMQAMFSLHRWLLLDKIEEPIFGELENRKLGSYITGTATILFTLGVITGMIIWFPKKLRSWKQGFKIKWSGNWKRINHDLHNSLGLYSCILLL